MQNLTAFHWLNAGGKLINLLGNAVVSWNYAKDVGAIAVEALARPQYFNNQHCWQLGFDLNFRAIIISN